MGSQRVGGSRGPRKSAIHYCNACSRTVETFARGDRRSRGPSNWGLRAGYRHIAARRIIVASASSPRAHHRRERIIGTGASSPWAKTLAAVLRDDDARRRPPPTRFAAPRLRRHHFAASLASPSESTRRAVQRLDPRAQCAGLVPKEGRARGRLSGRHRTYTVRSRSVESASSLAFLGEAVPTDSSTRGATRGPPLCSTKRRARRPPAMPATSARGRSSVKEVCCTAVTRRWISPPVIVLMLASGVLTCRSTSTRAPSREPLGRSNTMEVRDELEVLLASPREENFASSGKSVGRIAVS